MSLEEYFYKVFCKNKLYKDEETKRQKFQILVSKSLNYRPRFPIDYDYAHTMIIHHKPWRHDEPLNKIFLDKLCTITNYFENMIKYKQVPYYVFTEYARTVIYSQQHKIKSRAKDKP